MTPMLDNYKEEVRRMAAMNQKPGLSPGVLVWVYGALGVLLLLILWWVL